MSAGDLRGATFERHPRSDNACLRSVVSYYSVDSYLRYYYICSSADREWMPTADVGNSGPA
jgi:hypothetical protein